MQKSTKSKRKKLKSFTLTPVSAPLLSPAGSSTSWQAAARGVAVQAVSSLKRTLDGSLKLVSHRIVGTTEPAPGVVEDKRPTVEEVLSGFLKQSEELGWDQGYTDSFIESGTDFAEIELDPESDKRKRETGQGVSFCFCPSTGLTVSTQAGQGLASLDEGDRRVSSSVDHPGGTYGSGTILSCVWCGWGRRLSLHGLR